MFDDTVRAYALIAIVVIIALAAIGCLYLDCV
jgi:hypothetical protein